MVFSDVDLGLQPHPRVRIIVAARRYVVSISSLHWLGWMSQQSVWLNVKTVHCRSSTATKKLLTKG